jgi:hypothetical protein
MFITDSITVLMVLSSSKELASVGLILQLPYTIVVGVYANPFGFPQGWFFHFLLPWEGTILSMILELVLVYNLYRNSYYEIE